LQLNFANYESSEIEQVQFQAWPDHGVPDLHQIDALHSELLRLRALAPNSPVSVHCSAGVGRTGCLVAVANVVEAARATRQVRVLETVMEIHNPKASRTFKVKVRREDMTSSEHINQEKMNSSH
jgi:receptor-type tyrosine-protein phosphatase eta